MGGKGVRKTRRPQPATQTVTFPKTWTEADAGRKTRKENYRSWVGRGSTKRDNHCWNSRNGAHRRSLGFAVCLQRNNADARAQNSNGEQDVLGWEGGPQSVTTIAGTRAMEHTGETSVLEAHGETEKVSPVRSTVRSTVCSIAIGKAKRLINL